MMKEIKTPFMFNLRLNMLCTVHTVEDIDRIKKDLALVQQQCQVEIEKLDKIRREAYHDED